MPIDEKSRNYYSARAKEYTAHVRNPAESIYHAYYEKPAMYAILPDLEGKTVLSVGCGSGEDSIYLKKRGAKKSVGIDLSKELIDIAKDSYPLCEFHVMDMEALTFPDATFDFAYSSLAIHYIEDWDCVFKNVYRVLKSNSNFLFSCWHPLRFAMDARETDYFSSLKLEIMTKKSTGEQIITGNYLEKRKTIDSLGENTANTWTLPLGDISRSAAEAGFFIELLVDPRPQEALRDIDPQTFHRLNRIPEFVIFKLKKI